MAQTQSLNAPTLLGAVLPALPDRRAALARNIALAIVGSLLLVAAAKIKVPFWPVPMTLQTLAVLGIGAAYGSRLGAATVAIYLAYGLASLPVFTNTPPVLAGPLYFAGPTGGFLLGFIAAAAIAGWAAARGAGLMRLVFGLIAADAVLFGMGWLWLALGAQMASGATGIGFDKAFAAGIAPFLIGDAVKIALATCVVSASWSVLGKRS